MFASMATLDTKQREATIRQRDATASAVTSPLLTQNTALKRSYMRDHQERQEANKRISKRQQQQPHTTIVLDAPGDWRGSHC